MKGILALLLLCATSHLAAGYLFSALYTLQGPDATLGLLGTKLLGTVVCVLSITGSTSSDSEAPPVDPEASETNATEDDDDDDDDDDEEAVLQTKAIKDVVVQYGGGMKKSVCKKLCKNALTEGTYDGALSKAREFTTADSISFLHYTVEPKTERLMFKVKAPNDAYVVLSSGTTLQDPRYEVRIGILSNYQTFITKENLGIPVATTVTPKILSKDEFRQFWISWSEGTIRIGRGGEKKAFLAYADPNLFEVKYLGFSTRFGSKGIWEVEKLVEMA